MSTLDDPDENPTIIPSGLSSDRIGISVAARIGLAHKSHARVAATDTWSKPVELDASMVSDAAPFTWYFLAFPAVTPFKMWEILRISIMAPDPSVTLANVNVTAHRSSYVPQAANVVPNTFGSLIAVLGSVPNTAYPTRRAVFLRNSERVILAIKGLAANQQLQANMDAIEHDPRNLLDPHTEPNV